MQCHLDAQTLSWTWLICLRIESALSMSHFSNYHHFFTQPTDQEQIYVHNMRCVSAGGVLHVRIHVAATQEGTGLKSHAWLIQRRSPVFQHKVASSYLDPLPLTSKGAVKLLLGTSAFCYAAHWSCLPASLSVPASGQCMFQRHKYLSQISRSLPPMWRTQTEFLDFRFSLGQLWQLQVIEEWTSR